jgi:uncharacterized membrane protein
MRLAREFVKHSIVGGLFVLLPIYLALLLLLKAMQTAAGFVRPFVQLLPESFPAERILSLLLVLAVCFVVGLLVQTAPGRALRERFEKSVLDRIPGYGLVRSLTQQFAGTTNTSEWKPALAEIEDALVPAFIVEELDDGRYTVLVPSIPTPLAGAVYILPRERVHIVDIPFAQAVRSIVQWGSGSKNLVAAIRAR